MEIAATETQTTQRAWEILRELCVSVASTQYYELGPNSARTASARRMSHSANRASRPKKKRNTGGSETNSIPPTRPRFL